MPNESTATNTPEISGGIEWYDHNDTSYASCARCGSSADWVRCWKCGGDGTDGHDCGEDTCCCLRPEDNVTCDVCRATGGAWRCVSSPEYCESHPILGRESIVSTAMNSQAWSDLL